MPVYVNGEIILERERSKFESLSDVNQASERHSYILHNIHNI